MIKNNKQRGFTIIEVALVLAVAALIFLVVFLAVPALQRNQRDDARKRDVSMVAQAIANWSANGTEPLQTGTGTYAGYLLLSNRQHWLWEGSKQRMSYGDYDKGKKCGGLGKYIDNLSGNVDYVGITSVKDGTTTFDVDHDATGANGFNGYCQTAASEPYINAIIVYVGSKCNNNAGIEKATKQSVAVAVQVENGGKGKYYCQNAN